MKGSAPDTANVDAPCGGKLVLIQRIQMITCLEDHLPDMGLYSPL